MHLPTYVILYLFWISSLDCHFHLLPPTIFFKNFIPYIIDDTSNTTVCP